MVGKFSPPLMNHNKVGRKVRRKVGRTKVDGNGKDLEKIYFNVVGIR
jgi:hypothetical protein